MKEKFKRLWKAVRPCAIPGLITLAVVIITLIFKGIWPFGSNRIDYFDNMQQVAPIYTHLWDWLHGDASLWFDWYTGFGTNLSMTVSAFSMLSPFNILLYLIPRSLILESISILTVVKMVFMSVTMYIYISKKYPRLQYCLKTIFAVGFSLCGYVLLYGSCFTPWMDVVALFPLLMMAYDKMMKTGKKLFYIVILGIIVAVNYYLGAMSLVYIFILSGIQILTAPTRKRWKDQIWNLGIGTIAGLGLSCFTLVPCVMQLSTSQRGSGGGSLIHQYFGWITSAIVSDGTMAAFQRWMMLFGMAFPIMIIINGLIKYRNEKKLTIGMAATVIVVLIPVIIQGTNLMWHFGSYNGYTLRNGYLIAFTLITVAGYYAERMFKDITIDKNVLKKQYIIAAAVCIVYMIGYTVVPENNSICAIIFFMGIFIAMLYVYYKKFKKEKDAFNYKTAAIMMFVELFIAAYSLIGPPKFYTYEDYQFGDYVQDANKVYEELDIEESAINRIINPDISLNANYPLILRRGALSSFTAALQSDTQTFAKKWGYSKYFLWLLDSGGTVFTDAIFHVTEAVNQNALDSQLYTLEKSSGDYSLYSANYQLPFAMAVSRSVETESLGGDWVDLHNKMYTAMTGDNEELVTGMSYTVKKGDDVIEYTATVNGRSAVYMNIADVTNRNSDANCSKLESSMHIYVNDKIVTIPTLGNVANTAYFTDYNNNLVYLGIFEDEDISIRIEYDKPKYMKLSEVTMGQLNMDKMEAMCNKYNADDVNVSYDNNSMTINMTGTASKNYALVPVINSSNWKITVNGKKVSGREIAGIFTGVRIYAGENTIVFKYQPKGIDKGMMISAATLLLIVLCMVINHFRKIKVVAWLKYTAEFIYLQALNAIFVAMFLIPAVTAIPALIYQIVLKIMKLF